MNRIIKIGMDVHSTNYTLCAMEPTIGAEDRIFGEIQVAPDYKEVLCFIESLKMKLGFLMIILLNAVTRRAALVIPFITSSQELESNVSYLHRQPCSPSRASGSKRIGEMPV